MRMRNPFLKILVLNICAAENETTFLPVEVAFKLFKTDFISVGWWA